MINGGNLDVDVVLEGPNQEIIYKKIHEQYDTIHFKTNVSEPIMRKTKHTNTSKTPVSFVIQLIYYLLCEWSVSCLLCAYLFQVSGEYIVCFSNQFSTFSHKTVFFSFVAGKEKSIIPSGDDLIGPLTFIEATADEIHKSLNSILDTQTHYRLVKHCLKTKQKNLPNSTKVNVFFFIFFMQQEATGRRFAEDISERVLCWSLLQTFIIIALSISQVLILRNFFSDTMPNKPYPVRVRQPRYAQL